MMSEVALSTRYDASQVEAKWYENWRQAGLFQPDLSSKKPVFCITIPPPNITGSLHMGHALCYPIQDLIGRYQRLRGKEVLILPGQDHAGIATQSVVAKNLKAKGIDPSALGREKFVEEVWKWRKESGDTILRQFEALGCAYDWSRLRFTLDEDYAQAVLKVFVDWFERGLIYRGKRVVNWDPVLQTSVSDIETERKLIQGKLYHIRYPFADGSGHLIVATTRPETMLADVAVAVHPSDKRYQNLIGKKLILPLMGREIPLIADEYPDPEFGTGAVKITPAHDPNDFEVGQRHGLEMPVVLDSRARINENGGVYAGLDRYEARKRIVQDLEDQGLLEKVENYEIAVLVSDRSKEVIEPLLSEQWFVRQTQLAGPAIEVVKQGKIRFHPERYTRVYLEWMENIRDWCISRQLWWGHRIPIYYDSEGQAYAALSLEEAQVKAGGKKIVRQEEDVLDTWFSSGLWPFATLGWPDQAEDLKHFYPTNVLVTDRNIIYLWVARMIMMGLDFMGEIPFHHVYVHATVLTEDGKRMSKSLGTGIDPVEAIREFGADALRYALFSQCGENQDIRYGPRRAEEARNFCNKIWNAARFVLMNLEGFSNEKPKNLELVDRWILSRLAKTEATVRESIEAYNLQAATQALYQFFWSDYCDWYIEVSKSRLADPLKRQTPQWVLLNGLRGFLSMMHPIMPHLTEEIGSHLPGAVPGKFLMASSWPEALADFEDPEAERLVERWFAITRALRALRAEVDLDPRVAIPKAFFEGNLDSGESTVASQAWVEELVPGKPQGKMISTVAEGVTLHLPIEGLVDPAAKLEKLSKDIAKTEADLEKVKERLADPMFKERAKPEIVQRETNAAEELQARLNKLLENRSLFLEGRAS